MIRMRQESPRPKRSILGPKPEPQVIYRIEVEGVSFELALRRHRRRCPECTQVEVAGFWRAADRPIVSSFDSSQAPPRDGLGCFFLFESQ